MDSSGMVRSRPAESNDDLPQNSAIPTLLTEPAASESQQFRSQVGHISRHSGVFFLGTVFTAALGYVFKVYLARVLGPEALGIYALGITLVSFFGVFNSFGMVETVVRYAGVYRASNRLEQLRSLLWRGGATMMAANLLCAVIFLTAGTAAARHIYRSQVLVRYMPWFAALLILGTISVFSGRILAGYQQVGRRTLITNFIGTPATMICAILLLGLGLGLRGYLLAQVLAALLVIILLLMMVRKQTPPQARRMLPWPGPLESELWSFSATATGIACVEFLTGQADKIALGFYLHPRDVGIYSVAAAVVTYVSLILNSVNPVFSPVISDLHARGDIAMLGRLYKALAKWVLALTLPLAITVIVYAHQVMGIFGQDFQAGWSILIIGTAGQLINCGVGSVGLILYMSGNQRIFFKVQAGMAIFIVLANIALIPVWGIVGAAIAAALTNAGTNLWNFLAVRKVFGFSPFSRSFARLLAPCAASLLAALVIRRSASMIGHDWLLVGIALLGTYAVFAGVTAALGLDTDDRLIVDALRARVRGAAWNGWGAAR